jgi:hypothetical protein
VYDVEVTRDSVASSRLRIHDVITVWRVNQSLVQYLQGMLMGLERSGCSSIVTSGIGTCMVLFYSGRWDWNMLVTLISNLGAFAACCISCCSDK